MCSVSEEREIFLQNHPSQCSPEAVQRLQQIFEGIWHRLETSGSQYTFPWEAQASREKIAVQLCRRMNDLFIDAEGVEQDIFEMFGESKQSEKSDSSRLSCRKAQPTIPRQVAVR
jgi:hypothetical protein